MFGTETLQREKLEEGKKATARRQITTMAEVCTISKESLKKQEDDGAKGGVGEKIGRAKDKEDQTFRYTGSKATDEKATSSLFVSCLLVGEKVAFLSAQKATMKIFIFGHATGWICLKMLF